MNDYFLRWFEYMGTSDYSPMALTYVPVENSSSAIDVPTLPCSESYDVR